MISAVKFTMQKYLCFWVLGASLFTACGGGHPIQKNGLPYASIGDPMPAMGNDTWQGLNSRDTLFDEGGFQWRGLILSDQYGEVLIESDFEDQSQVNRIRVENSQLLSRQKLKVGMTVGEMRKKWSRWRLFYYPQYGLVDVSSPAQPSIHYLVREQNLTPAELASGGLKLKDLSEQTPIVAIVVM
jgi:hypothetical protein